MIDYSIVPERTEEHKVKTSCAKCIFKVQDEESKQIGCRFNNRIEAFISKPEVDVVYETEDDTTYCLIDRMCTSCVQKVPDNVEDDVKFVREKLQNQLSIVIMMDTNTTKEQVLTTFLSAADQKLAADKIIVSYEKGSGMDAPEVYRLLSGSQFSKYKANMIVVQNITDKTWDEQLLVCANKCDTPYFTFFEAGQKIPFNMVSTIDEFVNEELANFISIGVPLAASSLSGTVLMTHMFKKMCESNITKSILEGEGNKLDAHNVIYEMVSVKEGALTWDI